MTGRDRSMRWTLLTGLAAALISFALGCLALPHHGPTWDAVMGELPFGERLLGYLETGDEAWVELSAFEPRPRVREPHLHLGPPRFRTDQVYPFAALLSALSCRLLWTELGWFDSVIAHHLPAVAFAALAVGLVAACATRWFGAAAGSVAAILLIFAPRFSGHAANNLKDMPEAALYTASVLAGLAALSRGGWRWWGATGTLTAMAMAQKANALFVPVQLGAFFLLAWCWPVVRRQRRVRLDPAGVAVAAIALLTTYLALSPHLWSAPGPRLMAHLREVLAVGNSNVGASSASVGISLHGLTHALWTTPIPFLLLAAIGLLRPGLTVERRLFLALAVAVPLGRTALPGMRNFDGIRHFLEFLPALAISAGAGFEWLLSQLRRVLPAPAAGLLLGSAACLPGALATLRAFPDQLAWYNGLSGGLAAQQEAGELSATDYWGNGYWRALRWLAEHADPEAEVLICVAPHVARASAPLVLADRDDLRLRSDGDLRPFEGRVYAMYITRTNWYGPFVRALEEHSEPAWSIELDGAPLLRLHALEATNDAGLLALWVAEQRAAGTLSRVLDRLREHPQALLEAWSLLQQQPPLPAARIATELAPLVPELDPTELEDAVRALRDGEL